MKRLIEVHIRVFMADAETGSNGAFDEASARAVVLEDLPRRPVLGGTK
jgi:hypothetical protein